jgi:hypothetical protein
MRIKAELATQREEFVLRAFLNDKDLNGRECNDRLQDEFGWRMNLGKIYRLKKQADEIRAKEEGASE